MIDERSPPPGWLGRPRILRVLHDACCTRDTGSRTPQLASENCWIPLSALADWTVFSRKPVSYDFCVYILCTPRGTLVASSHWSGNVLHFFPLLPGLRISSTDSLVIPPKTKMAWDNSIHTGCLGRQPRQARMAGSTVHHLDDTPPPTQTASSAQSSCLSQPVPPTQSAPRRNPPPLSAPFSPLPWNPGNRRRIDPLLRPDVRQGHTHRVLRPRNPRHHRHKGTRQVWVLSHNRWRSIPDSPPPVPLNHKHKSCAATLNISSLILSVSTLWVPSPGTIPPPPLSKAKKKVPSANLPPTTRLSRDGRGRNTSPRSHANPRQKPLPFFSPECLRPECLSPLRQHPLSK